MLIFSSSCLADGHCEKNELASYLASGHFFGNVKYLTNYLLDGVSFSDNKPAVQANMGYALPNSIYTGVWASNTLVDDVTTATSVFYPYIGWSGDRNNFLWDLRLGYNVYFSTGDSPRNPYNYWDAHGQLGYQYQCVKAYITLIYAHDYYSTAGNFFSPGAAVEIHLPYDFYLYGTYAHVFLQENDTYGVPNYNHWLIGLKRTMFKWLILTLAYHDTDISERNCFAGSCVCSSGLLFTIGHEF